MKTQWSFPDVPWHRKDDAVAEPTRAGREGDSQELPTADNTYLGDVQELMIADIAARRQLGIERYGQALKPFNGRSSIKDAYEEALDLCCYLRQKLLEEEIAT